MAYKAGQPSRIDFYDSGLVATDTYWYPGIGSGFAYVTSTDKFRLINSSGADQRYQISSYFTNNGGTGGAGTRSFTIANNAQKDVHPSEPSLNSTGEMQYGWMYVGSSGSSLATSREVYEFMFHYVNESVCQMRVWRHYWPHGS